MKKAAKGKVLDDAGRHTMPQARGAEPHGGAGAARRAAVKRSGTGGAGTAARLAGGMCGGNLSR
jgi:hypothetical protein